MLCPSCGSENPPAARDCQGCGQPMAGPGVQASAPPSASATDVYLALRSGPKAARREQKNLNEVAGWLMFLCFYLVGLTPAFALQPLYEIFKLLFGDGGSRLVPRVWTALAVQIFMISSVLIWSVITGVQLLRRTRNAHRNAIVYFLGGTVVTVAARFAPPHLTGFAPRELNMEDLKWTVGAVIPAAGWIVYLMKSKRVSAIFGPLRYEGR